MLLPSFRGASCGTRRSPALLRMRAQNVERGLVQRGYSATLLFFDDDETSETYTERVVRCPGCGQQLVEGIFTIYL
jgi:hypothetical protein